MIAIRQLELSMKGDRWVNTEEKEKILAFLQSDNIDLVSCGLSLWSGFIDAYDKDSFQADVESILQCSVFWDGNDVVNIVDI